MAQEFNPDNGKLIKQRIKEKGYTQAVFAEKIPCEERTLRKWLRNGITNVKTLLKIADIFECDVRDLFLK